MYTFNSFSYIYVVTAHTIIKKDRIISDISTCRHNANLEINSDHGRHYTCFIYSILANNL